MEGIKELSHRIPSGLWARRRIIGDPGLCMHQEVPNSQSTSRTHPVGNAKYPHSSYSMGSSVSNSGRWSHRSTASVEKYYGSSHWIDRLSSLGVLKVRGSPSPATTLGTRGMTAKVGSFKQDERNGGMVFP